MALHFRKVFKMQYIQMYSNAFKWFFKSHWSEFYYSYHQVFNSPKDKQLLKSLKEKILTFFSSFHINFDFEINKIVR